MYVCRFVENRIYQTVNNKSIDSLRMIEDKKIWIIYYTDMRKKSEINDC